MNTVDEHANRFWNTYERLASEGLASPVGQALAAHRLDWSVDHTGGGCLTFAAALPGAYVWITEDDGASLPLSLDTPVCIGIYDADSDDCQGFVTRYLPSVTEALAFLDESREWMAALCEEFRQWRKQQGIDVQAFRGDAFELLFEDITDGQRRWLTLFVEHWDSMEKVRSKAGEA